MRGQRKVVVAEEYLFVEIHSLESSGAIRTRCRELVVDGYDPRSVPNQWHRLWKITWNKTCHFDVGVSTRHLHSYVRKYPAHGLVRKYTALSHMCKFDLLHLSVNLDYAVSYVNSLGAGAVFSTLKHNWRGKNIKNYFQRKVYWPCTLSVDIGKTEALFQRTYPLERIRSLWRFFFSFLFWFLDSLDACSDDFERSDPVPLAVCSLHFSSFGSPLFLDTALRLSANENKTSSTEVV